MSKNTLIRDYVINNINDYIDKGYQINDNILNKILGYWSIDKKLFDKKVFYKVNYDNVYNYNYYTDFQYKN